MLRGPRLDRQRLAVALGLGTNGLYYHLRILEEAQLIVPTGGRPGPKGIERTYRLADNQHVDWELDEDLVMLFASLLEAAKLMSPRRCTKPGPQWKLARSLPHSWGCTRPPSRRPVKRIGRSTTT